MKKSLNLEYWQLLALVGQTRSLARAAEALGIDPAQASRMMASLESELGLSLLSRSVKPLAPTAALEALMPLVRRSLSAHARVMRLAGQLSGTGTIGRTRTLRIALPVNTGRQIYINALMRLTDRHPEVQIDIGTTPRNETGLLDLFDIALCGYQPQGQEFFSVPLESKVYFLMATRKYLDRWGTPLTLEDLRRHTLIMRSPSDRAFSRILVHGSQRQALSESEYRILHGDASFCQQQLLAGNGIAVDLSAAVVADELLEKTVLPVLPDWHREPWQRCVCCGAENASDSLVREYMEKLRRADSQSFLNDWRFWYRHCGLPIEG